MNLISKLTLIAFIVLSICSCGDDKSEQLTNTLEISSQADIEMFCDQYENYQSRIDIKSQVGMDFSCLEPIKVCSDFSISGYGIKGALVYVEELIDKGLTIGNITDESIELPNVRILEDILFIEDKLNVKRFIAPEVEQIGVLSLLPLCKSIEEINGFSKVVEAESIFISAIGDSRSLVIDGFQNLEEVDVLSFNFDNTTVLLENDAFAKLRTVTNYLYLNARDNGTMDISNLLENLEFVQRVVVRGNIPDDQICEFKKFFDIEGFKIETDNFESITKEDMEILCP